VWLTKSDGIHTLAGAQILIAMSSVSDVPVTIIYFPLSNIA